MSVAFPHLRFDMRRTITATALFLIAATLAAAKEPDESAAALAGHLPVRVNLQSNGIKPFAELTTETWGNVAGGLDQGAWWNQLLNFGFELNTEKMGAWVGGKFLAEMHWVANSRRSGTFSDYTGGVNPVSGIMASDQVRVFNLYYQQSWRDDAVVLKLGQLAVDDDFMLSSYNSLFANSALGAMPSQVGNRLGACCGFSLPFPVYSVAAPGLFLSIRPAQPFYVQAGLYDGRPGLDTPGNHGFDWATESHFEAGFFLEAGYQYNLGSLPATLKLGMSHHTGNLESFSALETRESDTKQAVPNFYLVHDLELLRSSQGNPVLGLFGRAGTPSEPNRSMVGLYADVGLNWRGPIPGRAEDVTGVAISYTGFGETFLDSTASDGLARNQTTVELAYKAQINRWFSLQGDVQVLLNSAAYRQTGARETGIILGLRAQLAF